MLRAKEKMIAISEKAWMLKEKQAEIALVCDPLQARSRSLDPGGGSGGGEGERPFTCGGGGRGPSRAHSKVSSRKIDEQAKTT